MSPLPGAALAIVLTIAGAPAAAETVARARYAAPVERYGHYALGRPHEYARLEVATEGGRKFALELAADEVFEDLAPRMVRLTAEGPAEVLAVVSHRESGARLALFGVEGGRLVRRAQSAPIGTPMRWLNPIGVADLDGDGRAEIAAVITPHIGGILKVYAREGATLVERATLPGFSNHAYGSTEQSLAATVVVEGRARLVVPDAARTTLRVVAYAGGQLIETAQCRLPSPVTGELKPLSEGRVKVNLSTGPYLVALGACTPAAPPRPAAHAK